MHTNLLFEMQGALSQMMIPSLRRISFSILHVKCDTCCKVANQYFMNTNFQSNHVVCEGNIFQIFFSCLIDWLVCWLVKFLDFFSEFFKSTIDSLAQIFKETLKNELEYYDKISVSKSSTSIQSKIFRCATKSLQR